MSRASEIVKGLIKLQEEYCRTYRAITTKERYTGLVESGVLKEFSYDLELLREPLMEHVGHLPVIAAYLHPYLKNRDKVDLGKTLLILAIHDIGETVTGDILTYSKKKKHDIIERREAKNKLPAYLFNYYEEYEKLKTLEAKFAKSVDALSPILHEFSIPKVTFERLKHFKFTVDAIKKKKTKYFAWDPTMENVFVYLIKEFRKIEKKYSESL